MSDEIDYNESSKSNITSRQNVDRLSINNKGGEQGRLVGTQKYNNKEVGLEGRMGKGCLSLKKVQFLINSHCPYPLT